MEVFFSPGNRICFEKPAAGWRAVPGGAAAVVSLLHDSGEAAVVVERVSTGPWFTPGEVNPALADREEEAIRGQDPDASCLEATLVSLGERRMVAIDYGRTGLAGPERVRQYSIPAGSGLFRLTCSATEARFASLEPVFVHVASTFATGT
jgi:hypothetical protein